MLLANSHILDKMSDHMRELYVVLRREYPLALVKPFDDDHIEFDYKGETLTINTAGKEKYRVRTHGGRNQLCAKPRDVLYFMDGHYDDQR